MDPFNPFAGFQQFTNTDIPGNVAQSLTSAGIRPEQFLQNPGAALSALRPAQPAWPDVGASLSPTPAPGVPMPQPRPTPGQDLPAQASQGSAQGPAQGTPQDSMGDRLTKTLQGVKAPAAPTPQQVRTPAVPSPHGTIKGGELIALLQSLGLGGGQLPQNAVPMNLGPRIGVR